MTKAYHDKRNLAHSGEPAAEGRTSDPGQRYVMHKHDASQLHYDLRLEQNGVLRSWALPKGPSLQVGEKRLAVEVEDHPLAYGDFEGVIPPDNYGGGTVMLWDRGHWCQGETQGTDQIDFSLHGDKLSGSWSLVRMANKSDHNRHKNKNWLLIKRRDKNNQAETSLDQLDDHSVLSGRSMAAIAATEQGGNDCQVAGVQLSHPDRVLYPDMDVTKRDLAQYFEDCQDWILPELVDRPVSLLRCPEGQDEQCFFQKHPHNAIPAHVPRLTVQEQNGRHDYVYVRTIGDLVALVQAGTLELHVWGSRVDDIERPDRLIFDLDPDASVAWSDVVRVARDLRDRLQDLGLASFVRITGGKGLHLVIPLTRKVGWDTAKDFAQAVAQQHASDEPQLLTTNMAKDKRCGRVFIDYLRNARGATAIASYSTRARPGAPIAAPIRWDELGPQLRPNHYDINNLSKRLAALKNDPWADFKTAKRPLTQAMLQAVGML